MPHIWSTIHAVGVMEIQLSPTEMGVLSSHFPAMSLKLRWGSIASLGTPVVPEVMIMSATSSGFPFPSSSDKPLRLFSIQFFTLFQKFRKADEPGIVRVRPHAGRIDVDDPPHVRKFFFHFDELVDLLLVLDDHDGRLRCD